MGYKMKGSPAKLGSIQGTAGHSSALKMASSPAPFIGKVIGAVGKAAGVVSKITGGAGKIGKMASNIASGAGKAGDAVKKGKDYLSKRKAKKTEKKKMYDVGSDSSPAKMAGASNKKITSNAEKRANLLKAVPNKKAYDKLSDVDKKGFDKVGKKVGLPQKKASPGKMKIDPQTLKSKSIAIPRNRLYELKKAKTDNTRVKKARKATISDYNKKFYDKSQLTGGNRELNAIAKKNKIKPPTKWIGTAIKVVGKGLSGRAKSQQARDDAKNKGVQDSMSRGSAVSKY